MKAKLLLLWAATAAAIWLASPAVGQLLPVGNDIETITTHRWMAGHWVNCGGQMVGVPSHWHPMRQGCAICQGSGCAAPSGGGICRDGICQVGGTPRPATPITASPPAVVPSPYGPPVATDPAPTNSTAPPRGDLKTEIIKVDNAMLAEIIRRTSANVIGHIEANPSPYRGARGEAGPQGNASTGPRGPAGPPGKDGRDGKDGAPGADAIVNYTELTSEARQAAVEYLQAHADEFRGPPGPAGDLVEVDYDRVEQSAINAAVGYVSSNPEQFRGPPGTAGGSLDLASISESDYEKLVNEVKRRIAGAIRVRVEPVRK